MENIDSLSTPCLLFKIIATDRGIERTFAGGLFRKKHFCFSLFFLQNGQTQSEAESKSFQMVLHTQVTKEKYQVENNRDWCHLWWQTTEPD